MTEETIKYMKLMGSTYSYVEVDKLYNTTYSTIRKLGRKAGVWDNPDYVVHINGTDRFTDRFLSEIVCN